MARNDEKGMVDTLVEECIKTKDDTILLKEDEDEDGSSTGGGGGGGMMCHPYGVLPDGNAMFGSNGSNCKDACIYFQWLKNDESLWCQNILTYCDGISLCQLVQCCRYLYVLGHVPTLWRDLVLSSCISTTNSGTSSTNTNTTNTLTELSTYGWKDTWTKLHHHHGTNTNTTKTRVHHIPMSIPNMYSDYLFHLHTCGNFVIPSHWYIDPTNTNTSEKNCVPRIPYCHNNNNNDDDDDPNHVMDKKRILQTYEDTNRPVVLTNIPSWNQLAQKWQTYLLSDNHNKKNKNNTNNTTSSSSTKEEDDEDDRRKYCSNNPYEKERNRIALRATSGSTCHSANFTLAGYQSYCSSNWSMTTGREEAPLYLFDRQALLGKCPQLSHDIQYQENYERLMEPFLLGSNAYDLFQELGEPCRPDHTWLIAGPKRSGSMFHVDPNATHAWNACISGQKRWIFYSPNIPPPPGVHPSHNGEDVCMPISLGEWFTNFYHTSHQQRLKQHPHHVLECTVTPGDVLFVPHGWWHAVINIGNNNNNNNNNDEDDGMNMAVTHNYVSSSNLSTVLRFLNTKRNLISGCRDRPQEAIQPSHLYETCTDLWNRNTSRISNTLYQQAFHKSQQGWTNAAWNDDDHHHTNNNNNDKQTHQKCTTTATGTCPNIRTNTTLQSQQQLLYQKKKKKKRKLDSTTTIITSSNNNNHQSLSSSGSMSTMTNTNNNNNNNNNSIMSKAKSSYTTTFDAQVLPSKGDEEKKDDTTSTTTTTTTTSSSMFQFSFL